MGKKSTVTTGKKRVSKAESEPVIKVKAADDPNAALIVSMEKAIINNPPGAPKYVPNTVRRGTVTLDEVVNPVLLEYDIAEENIVEVIENAISNHTAKDINKVSLVDGVLEENVLLKPLSSFKRAVLEAALSQLAAGNNKFTSAMLYRTMSGKPSNGTVSQSQMKMVDDAINALAYTPMTIEGDMYDKSGNLIEAKHSGPILPVERIDVTISGHKVTAFHITSTPLIYRWAMARGGIATTPIDLLSVKTINYTYRNFAILSHIQRRIAPLIYPISGEYVQPEPITIGCDELYRVATDGSNTVLSGTAKSRIRETVHAILDSWVERKYIRSWKDVASSKNREVVGIRISFAKDPPPPLPEYTPLLGE